MIAEIKTATFWRRCLHGELVRKALNRKATDQVVQLVTQAGCNIVDSRIAIFGSEFTLIMLLTGNASSVTRVETQLPLLGQEHDLITIMKRTAAHELLDNSYTMEVFIESEDRPGLTEKFTKFFADQQIGLDSL
ncbi:glycine cleavage system protein R, partial [Vibrio parahaemolyticus]|uniref:glycine cleavage system protein R n=1 Tax=Vibrio parahaemolyticus TaxID=670 RepID=UPI0024B491DF